MVQLMKYEFIHFELIEQKPKAGVYACRNNRSGEPLGVVKWYPAWRQYCYFPTVQAVYSHGCLEDIQKFIVHVNSEKGKS